MQVVKTQRGVVFSQPAIVYRGMYSGRGIIAPNEQFSPTLVDRRGYLPVEWWIMSKTEARNAKPIKNEGIACLREKKKKKLLDIYFFRSHDVEGW